LTPIAASLIFDGLRRSAEHLLGFDRLREIVASFATCAPGQRAVMALAPRMERGWLKAEFAMIGEAIAYLRGGSELGFGSLADPESWLARLAVPGSVLTAAELLDASTLLGTVATARETLRGVAKEYPRLAERAASLGDFRAVATAIRRAVLPNGEISDDASSDLRRIRGELGRTRDRLQKSLDSILRARGGEPGQDYITLRNDRFVIPVLASDRRAVPGVVHGASGTGLTVFVEPLEAIEFNNRLVQLGEEELAEIARILAALTDHLRMNRGPLEYAAKTIAELDSIFARGRYARELDCAVPQFTTGRLRLDEARNPVLEYALRPQGRAVVPVTLALGNDRREPRAGAESAGPADAGDGTVMVISGPNTGGKTVALKTVGLAALAGQSGIPVPAQAAELPIFDHVLADIGDEQSITADLSTFSAHMLNVKSMLETATTQSLVLVDELGTGTAPEEGAALAVALLEEFRMRGALTIATTHHDRLKTYASTMPGIVNAAVEFDEVNLRPTYRLLVGVPGVSSGIEIARRLGLPARVVEAAQAGLSPETREARELISYLHRSRDEVQDLHRQAREERESLAAERRTLQTEWVDRQRKRIAELEKQFADTHKKFAAEIARLTDEIKDRKERAQLEKAAGRRLSRIETTARDENDAAVLDTLASSQQDLGVVSEAPAKPFAAEDLTPGARIYVRGMKQAVVFRRNDGRNAEIEAGALRMRVPLADVTGFAEPLVAAKGKTPVVAPSGITVKSQPTDEPSTDEINLIGTNVEEATRRVDKFLNASALAGKTSVRVIHGHGTGALRRGLAEFFTGHPLVTDFHFEAPDRGGEAITIVELNE
jgi:DNA mismatch repair protein MutS2